MARRARKDSNMARFPRLREIRERRLGWEVIELVTRLPGNRPSIASIYRMEQGRPVRVSNARRIFNILNEALGNTLDINEELVLETSDQTRGKRGAARKPD
jgi:hypothetical protein